MEYNTESTWQFGDRVEIVKIYMAPTYDYKAVTFGQKGTVRLVDNPKPDPDDQVLWIELDMNPGHLLGFLAGMVKKVEGESNEQV